LPTREELLRSAIKALDRGDIELAKKFMAEAQALEEKPKRFGPYCPYCSARLGVNNVPYVGYRDFCTSCGRAYTVTKEMMTDYAGARPATLTPPQTLKPHYQRPIAYNHEKKGSSATTIIALLIIIGLLAAFGLPLIANIVQHAGQSPIPIISQITYTAHIRTITTEHVRYNVVSWNIEKGLLFHNVTLYYVGGGSETFRWVTSYRFERE